MSRTWKQIVWQYIQLIADPDGYFTMKDFQPHLDAMAREKPNNPLILEKIRQQLQILQHEGKIKFLVPGSYKIQKQNPAQSELFS